MITRKFFFITVFAVLASVAGYAQVHEEGGISPVGDPAHKVELYPNPALEYLNVKFEAPCAKRIKLTLHNIIGNTVEVETEVIDEHELQLKVRDIPIGYYLLSIRDPDTNFKSTYKFLKR